MSDSKSENSVPPGITEFFSSQSAVMLAQFMNIEHLLGVTDDYTGPGTHCEVLLRDFLRQYLPSWVGVDKGFVFGRTNRWVEEEEEDDDDDDKASGSTVAVEKELHSPEIDILIHDTLLHRPLFRLEDFVIVQPEAVLGVIQVKRTLSTNQFRSGISNVVNTKRHLLEMHFQKEQSRSRMPDTHLFSAVVEFADKNRQVNTFKERLKEAYESQEKYESSQKDYARLWCLPSFIGSFSGKFATTVTHSIGHEKQSFAVYSAKHNDTNVGLQALLFRLTTVIWSFTNSPLRQVAHEKPPFAFPDEMRAIEQFDVPL